MRQFVTFMVTPAGRVIRFGAGAGLIAGGLLGIGGTVGIVVAVVGLVPALAGLFDFCVFAPLAGYPFSGPKIRANVGPHQPHAL